MIDKAMKSWGLTVLLLFFSAFTLFAGGGERLNSGENGIFLDGYDVVAYFTEERAVEGDSAFALDYRGVTFYFTNEEHRALFEADPERYLPQYGGYCAYGLFKGQLFQVEPDQFTIYNGKLYLNYSNSIRKKWLKKVDSYILKADENWEKLSR